MLGRSDGIEGVENSDSELHQSSSTEKGIDKKVAV